MESAIDGSGQFMGLSLSHGSDWFKLDAYPSRLQMDAAIAFISEAIYWSYASKIELFVQIGDTSESISFLNTKLVCLPQCVNFQNNEDIIT